MWGLQSSHVDSHRSMNFEFHPGHWTSLSCTVVRWVVPHSAHGVVSLLHGCPHPSHLTFPNSHSSQYDRHLPLRGSHVNFCFQLVVQPRFLISGDAASHRAFNCGQAKTGQSVTSTRGATPKRESPSPQLKGPHQSVGVHGEDEQKKKAKVGENPKMPYPPCGRSIKTYGRGNNDAPSVTKHGSPVRLGAQIVALRPHCAKSAPLEGMGVPAGLPFS